MELIVVLVTGVGLTWWAWAQWARWRRWHSPVSMKQQMSESWMRDHVYRSGATGKWTEWP